MSAYTYIHIYTRTKNFTKTTHLTLILWIILKPYLPPLCSVFIYSFIPSFPSYTKYIYLSIYLPNHFIYFLHLQLSHLYSKLITYYVITCYICPKFWWPVLLACSLASVGPLKPALHTRHLREKSPASLLQLTNFFCSFSWDARAVHSSCALPVYISWSVDQCSSWSVEDRKI